MAINITESHRQLARRYGKQPFLAPVSETLAELLAVVFSEEEADLASVFPVLPAQGTTLAKRGRISQQEAVQLLTSMDKKGLIVSYETKGKRKYALIPIIPGVFEFTMMTGKKSAKHKKFAELFTSYYNKEYLEPNAGKLKEALKIIPVEEHVSSNIGVLPTDRVSELIDSHDRFAIGKTCSCRHMRELMGMGCGLPKDVCMVFGFLADYTVERGFARKVDKQEMLEAAGRAEEAGLVHLADNVANAR